MDAQEQPLMRPMPSSSGEDDEDDGSMALQLLHRGTLVCISGCVVPLIIPFCLSFISPSITYLTTSAQQEQQDETGADWAKRKNKKECWTRRVALA